MPDLPTGQAFLLLYDIPPLSLTQSFGFSSLSVHAVPAISRAAQEAQMGRKPKQNEISRREFARRVALTTATAAALPAALLEEARAASPATQEAAKSPALTSASQAEVDSRVQAIFGRYGDRLSEVQKADVRRLILTLQQQLERLRAYSTANDDAPATVLKPIVERDKGRPAATIPAKPRKGGA